MMSIVMYKIKLKMGENNLMRVLMITLDILFSNHLSNSRSIDMIVNVRDRVGGIGYANLQLWYFPCLCPGPTFFHGR